MRKRTLALLLSGTFVFGTAAACSDDEGSTETDTTEAPADGETDTTEAPADEATTTTVAA